MTNNILIYDRVPFYFRAAKEARYYRTNVDFSRPRAVTSKIYINIEMSVPRNLLENLTI